MTPPCRIAMRAVISRARISEAGVVVWDILQTLSGVINDRTSASEMQQTSLNLNSLVIILMVNHITLISS